MNNPYPKGLVAALMLSLPLSAAAEDIDLFAGVQYDVDPPNVLFVLDNGANFSASVSTMRCSITAGGVVTTDGTGTAPTALDRTAGAVEQCALYSALQSLTANATAQINIGVMGFNANNMKQYDPVSNTFSSACVNGTGGCLLMPIVPFNASTKANILEWIRNWQISGGSDYNIKGDNSANGAVMQEAWAYYFGRTGVSGRSYTGMQPQSNCGNNYVIFVGNAYRNNSTPGDQTNEANSPLRPLNGTSNDANKRAHPPATAQQLALISGTIDTGMCGIGTLQAGSNAENRGAYALNWARYMRAQGITTYSIGVLGPTCNAEYAAHLTKLGAADVGGGGYFATANFQELKVSFETALSEIQTVNSAFASVSLPVSVNTEGTYLNQVYIGMFRPAENFKPRWAGNLKQYRMGLHNGVLRLLDAHEPALPAISGSGTGFLAECARSYWTPVNGDTYWSLFEQASCVGFDARSNTPDGNIVEKGAQGFVLRSSAPSARVVKTCGASCGAVLANFDADNSAITKAALGDASMSDADRAALINWARGSNNKSNDPVDNFLATSTAMRPSVHGDVVHSRPVAINYGTDADPKVVVFYGANDGMLRAINGNRNTAIAFGGTSYAAGSELWSFVAPESYPIFARLRTNEPAVRYRGSTVANALPKPYGFDGSVVAHRGAGHDWIYASMRRGGRMLYAFDVTTPNNPTLKWRRGCTDNFSVAGTVSDANCSTGITPSGESWSMSDIGQTWSSPKVFKAAGHVANGVGSEKPMLIFGGGYDVCEDHDAGGSNHACSASSKGARIYVLDADTGTVLKVLPTERSVVADVTVVPHAQSGLATYAYTADLGGNVYRINIGNAAPADWTITKIAALGCDTVGSCEANRKFMFAPDVVVEDGYHIVLVGSGDREKPLIAYTAATSVANHFFMLKDKPSDPNWLLSEADRCSGNALICLSSLHAIDSASDPAQTVVAEDKKGWALALRPTEQVVTSAITLYGVVTFSTHIPEEYVAGACTSRLGTASVYNIRYTNAASANGTESRYETIDGGGLPPSPVAGWVTLDDGTTVPFVIGASPTSPLESVLGGTPTSVTITQPKVRTYWYIEH